MRNVPHCLHMVEDESIVDFSGLKCPFCCHCYHAVMYLWCHGFTLRSSIVEFRRSSQSQECFPGASVVENLPASAGDTGDLGSIPGPGRSPGEGNGNPV